MATPDIIPMTVLGTFPGSNLQANSQALITIGDLSAYGPQGPKDNSYWYSVVDLTTLQVQVNVVSTSNTDVPGEVQQYVGNGNYLLTFTTYNVTLDNLPASNLYDMLKSVGAGMEFDRMEMVGSQLSTGLIVNTSYILTTTMDQNNSNGFEELSFTNFTLMTLGLVPVVVNGQTIYYPVQLT